MTAVFDCASVVNRSPDAIAMREILAGQDVTMIESQGPAALVLGLVRPPC